MDAAQQRFSIDRMLVSLKSLPAQQQTLTYLAQAYGEGSPILQEIMQGLQPTPTHQLDRNCNEAYYGLPGVSTTCPEE